MVSQSEQETQIGGYGFSTTFRVGIEKNWPWKPG
jgi:hypothetical protein